jgi:hypothetical protein
MREATPSRRSGTEQRSVLACPDIDALGGERRGAPSRGCVRKCVVAVRGERDVDEPGGLDERAKLSFQESTGYSAGPEGNVRFGILRDRLADHNIGDLQPPARLEHTIGLR